MSRGSGGVPQGRDAPVEIAPYDPAWPLKFDAERDLVAPVLAPWLDGGIHHVGSTAVPGLGAKPIIDIMAGVRDLDEARAAIAPLADLGYLYAPYRDWMLWFCKPDPAHRTHHLTLVEPSHPQWAHRLAFRDRLRADPETAAAYERLKRRLATEHRNDREAYTEAKTAFVLDTLHKGRVAQLAASPVTGPSVVDHRFPPNSEEI
ncbi:MAG: GrpB family protein [Egibacteraceae bacterium]